MAGLIEPFCILKTNFITFGSLLREKGVPLIIHTNMKQTLSEVDSFVLRKVSKTKIQLFLTIQHQTFNM